jgi:hypothetical protein
MWTLLVIAGLFTLGNIDTLVDMLPDLSGTPGTESPAAACPSEVAQWLPDGGSGATMEVAYTTPLHVITLCRTAAGQLYYDGQIQGQPVNSDTHISIPATATATGYVADNNSWRYEINGAEVIITNGGVEQKRYPLSRTGP